MHEEIDDILDRIERQVYSAQCIAFWQQSLLYEADVKIQDLIGSQKTLDKDPSRF